LLPELPPAVLALADGTVFRGFSIGAAAHATGEVVFNTAMSGYQEILTDPSYSQQLVTLTYPHIGNTGVNAEDEESTRIHAGALIIRDLPARVSNWRAQSGLSAYLAERSIPGIAGIDTRQLTIQPQSRWPAGFPGWPGWTWPRWSPPTRDTTGRKAHGH
jgi:carbamoyl-phosphate synthase small subunit